MNQDCKDEMHTHSRIQLGQIVQEHSIIDEVYFTNLCMKLYEVLTESFKKPTADCLQQIDLLPYSHENIIVCFTPEYFTTLKKAVKQSSCKVIKLSKRSES